MANKKRRVTLQDYSFCYQYFNRALQTEKLFEGEPASVYKVAQQLFETIPDQVTNEADVQQLQEWLDTHIEQDIQGKCYRSINQKKYRERNDSRSINISDEAHHALKCYAEQNQFTLSDAILQLLDNEGDASLLEDDFQSEVYDAPAATLFRNGIPIDDIFFNDGRISQPKKSEGYDYRKNASYKNYRKRIKEMTVSKIDDVFEDSYRQFCKGFFLIESTADRVSGNLLKLRDYLLSKELLLKTFSAEDFVISKGISMPAYQMEGYGEELLFHLSDFFGCDFTTITSGKREVVVLAGRKSHVQIAYKAFLHMEAFLMDEAEQFVQNCHKNTKHRNKLERAGWHCSSLLSKMFNPIFDMENEGHLFDHAESEKLKDHCFRSVGR